MKKHQNIKSILKEKQTLNETFRDVNILISSINQLQVKQDEAASRLKSNLDEISQLKTFLIESNGFESNLSFNRDWFGLLSSKSSSTFIFVKQPPVVQSPYSLASPKGLNTPQLPDWYYDEEIMLD